MRHGDTSAESFLLDAGAVVKKFVQIGGDSLSFNAIAMGPSAGGRDVLDSAGWVADRKRRRRRVVESIVQAARLESIPCKHF